MVAVACVTTWLFNLIGPFVSDGREVAGAFLTFLQFVFYQKIWGSSSSEVTYEYDGLVLTLLKDLFTVWQLYTRLCV